MAKTCKVCISQHRVLVEELLTKNYSYKSVADTLRDMGVDISHPTIRRHRINHMDLPPHVNGQVQTEPEPLYDTGADLDPTPLLIDPQAIYNQAVKKAKTTPTIRQAQQEMLVAHYLLQDIGKNQLAITLAMQQQFMQGKGRYPAEQIRGLKSIVDMVNNLAISKRANGHSFLYDLEKQDKKKALDLAFQDGREAGAVFGKTYRKGDMFKDNYQDPENPYADSDDIGFDLCDKWWLGFDEGAGPDFRSDRDERWRLEDEASADAEGDPDNEDDFN